MEYHEGDHIIHWIYGLGQILRLEEKILSGKVTSYYVVQLKDLTVWVPVDGEVAKRIRPPTPREEFPHLLEILKGENQVLPVDRLERRTLLQEEIQQASAEAHCRVIRDLSAFRSTHQLNDYDLLILNRTRASLLAEWSFSLPITYAQAEVELHRLISVF